MAGGGLVTGMMALYCYYLGFRRQVEGQQGHTMSSALLRCPFVYGDPWQSTEGASSARPALWHIGLSSGMLKSFRHQSHRMLKKSTTRIIGFSVSLLVVFGPWGLVGVSQSQSFAEDATDLISRHQAPLKGLGSFSPGDRLFAHRAVGQSITRVVYHTTTHLLRGVCSRVADLLRVAGISGAQQQKARPRTSL